MAPFVVLEFLGGEGAPSEFPLVRNVEHLGFSYQAAEQVAAWAPRPKSQQQLAKATNTVRRVVKYDALIVGCAKFHKVEVLVTLDDGVKALGKLAGVRTAEPKDLLRGTQVELFEK